MNLKLINSVLGLVVVSMLVLGCTEAPQQQIDAANAALQAATEAEADVYAADQFKAAKDSLDAAVAEIAKQNSKFALGRNYDQARNLLQAAVTAADSAKRAAAAGKEAVRVEADSVMRQFRSSLAMAKDLLTKAPTGKEGRAALEMIQSDIVSLETTLTEVSTAMAGGEYMAARDKAKAGLAKANGIVDELNQAIAKKASLSKGRS